MSSHCPISGKYVPRKNPSDGYTVLSPDGEEVRFCCPSHKTRYLRENPGSVELNPMAVPKPGSVVALAQASAGGLGVVIADAQRLQSGDYAGSVLAVIGVSEHEAEETETGKMVVWPWACMVAYARAVSGYGPFLYDLAAFAQAELEPDCPGIFASDIQSKEAQRFWRRQGGDVIKPLSRSQFKAKYGGLDPVALLRAGKELSPAQQKGLIVASNRFWEKWYSEPKDNPEDLKGRHIPEKYLAGLIEKKRRQRIAELTEQRDRMGKGAKRYADLETDRFARKKGLVKQSAYSQVAEKRGIQIRYKGAQPDFKATARAALRYYGARAKRKTVDEVADLLEQSYDKGLAAWQTGGHRPGASQRNWGDARVHSLLVGGKTAWYPSADRKQVRQFPRKMKEGIIRQMPEVFKALKAQGRQKDINYLRPRYNAAKKKI